DSGRKSAIHLGHSVAGEKPGGPAPVAAKLDRRKPSRPQSSLLVLASATHPELAPARHPVPARGAGELCLARTVVRSYQPKLRLRGWPLGEDEPLSIGGPRGCSVEHRIVGQLRLTRAVRVHHTNLEDAIRWVPAHEGNARTVRRP